MGSTLFPRPGARIVEFFIILVILLLVILVPLSIKQAQQANEAWSATARELGLHYQPGGFLSSRNIRGSYQGCQIHVDTYTVRSGKNNSTTYTRFRIDYPSLGMGLKLEEEGFFTGVTKFFGAQDIQVGDPAFDGDVLVKGSYAKRIQEFLTPARRMRILRFLKNHSGATITDNEISWRTHGVMRHQAGLVSGIQAGARLASHLTGDREDDRRLGRAIQAQDEGRPSEALAFLQNLESTKNPDSDDSEIYEAELVEEKILEGELLYMADRRDEAKQAFQAAHQAEPEDADLAEWAEHVTEPPPPPVTQEENRLSDLDAVALCQELFEKNKMSYQISREFEQQHAGKRVRWSGHLRRVESYSFELVFGSKPGCKGIITLHELQTNSFNDSRVSAIVQFPKEDLDRLKAREDQPITFEGQLKKVDALMRNFYLAEGRLIGD